MMNKVKYQILKKMNVLFKFFILSVILISFHISIAQNSSLLKTKDTYRYFKMPDNIQQDDYISKTIIFKIKSQYRNNCKKNDIDIKKLKNIISYLKVNNVYKKFPNKLAPAKKYNKQGEKFADLSLIYELKYSSKILLEKAINSLYATGLIEYAEPHYLPKLLYIPDDPYNDSVHQYYLTNIRAYQGWDISKGDTNIVIGIDDTGTDIDHPDLEGNIKYNYEDTIDGLDNDNDGYTDNFRGWDMGENDNNPQVNYWSHGAHVSGIVAASTDNGTGISGVGFKCKFLPVKIDDENGYLTMAYGGIVYAADHGVSVINCSWGCAHNNYGQYGQDIIDYATINKDVLVVAACGNTDSEIDFFPASYEHVISVAATNASDTKSTGQYASSYGINVDISAPGDKIYSTWNGGGYIYSSGTSMAAPIVSACAAIVKSHFPSYSAIQVGEKLKVTADNIDTIPENIPYAGKLGFGRVNLYRALTDTTTPSVLMINNNLSDNSSSFTQNDTLHIIGDFKNYLAPTTNLSVTLSSASPYVQILNSTTTLGTISTLETKSNDSDPFEVHILPSVPLSYTIDFKLDFEDGTYKAYQYFSIIVNVDYLNIDTNKIATTITSKGRLGYNDKFAKQGIGFLYDNDDISMLYCGGLLIGNSPVQVSDAVYGALNKLDNDFISVINTKKIIPPVMSDFDVYGVFSDSISGSTPLNVTVIHKAYEWNNTEDSKYVILEYTIKNDGEDTLKTLYTGFFVDWDLGNSAFKNRISYDSDNKMGYTYSTQGGTYAAIKLLTQGPVIHYAFDNDGQDGSITIFNSDGSSSFTGYDKYYALRTNRNSAGFYSQTGNDVSDMISSGPVNLPPCDSVKIAFALIAGEHLADIQQSAVAADQKYNNTSINDFNNLYNKIYLSNNYPNPFTKNTSVYVYLPYKEFVDISVFNLLGEKILTVNNSELSQGQHKFVINAENFKNGIYFYRLTTKHISVTKKMILIKS